MNEVRLIGRLVKDPEIRQTKKGSNIATYTLAVDRWNSATKTKEADFLRITAFGRNADFAEKWLHKGEPVVVYGSIHTSRFEKDGDVRYSTEIWVDRHEFAPLRKASSEPTSDTNVRDDDFFVNMAAQPETPNDDFIVIPDDADDEGLPFN